MRSTLNLATVAASLAPAMLLGQPSCPSGPGAAFGVVSYSCSSCEIEVKGDPRYSFHSELVVMKVVAQSALRAGDIIEAVDGQPITARQGAEAFTHPSAGKHVITVRRDGDREMVPATAACGSDQPTPRDPQPGAEPQGRFGFAIACNLSCKQVQDADGVWYWKYDDYPHIAKLRDGGPAERVGLRDGDVVTKIDGYSVLGEKGAMKLHDAEHATSIHITVLRAGREIGYLVAFEDREKSGKRGGG